MQDLEGNHSSHQSSKLGLTYTATVVFLGACLLTVTVASFTATIAQCSCKTILSFILNHNMADSWKRLETDIKLLLLHFPMHCKKNLSKTKTDKTHLRL